MDAVELTIEPRIRAVGTGEVRRLLPWRERRMVGPFVFADLMGPDHLTPGTGVDVDAHPHIGLSTLTYLFEGRMVHRDSTGAVQIIEPGDVNWMTAGSGVCHTERSHVDDRSRRRRLHGLQTWVALPTEVEDSPPFFAHHRGAEVPTVTHGSTTVRVVAGSGWSMISPVPVSSPLVMAEIRLGDDGRLVVDDLHPERAVLAVDGDLALDGRSLPEGRLAVLSRHSRPTLSGTGRAVVLGGDPVGPRHIWWNFVHHDPARIEVAKDDWRHQRFVPVPGDHDPWVPLPG